MKRLTRRVDGTTLFGEKLFNANGHHFASDTTDEKFRKFPCRLQTPTRVLVLVFVFVDSTVYYIEMIVVNVGKEQKHPLRGFQIRTLNV